MGLAHPVTSRYEERYGNARIKVAVASMQGFRRTMEDDHRVTLELKRNSGATPLMFAGVYDGHGGNEASRFCAKKIHEHIAALPDLSDKSLQKAVMEVDAEFLAPSNDDREHGSTCVFVLIDYPSSEGAPYEITVSNTGDSRALWGSLGATSEGLALTNDHKPNNLEERLRIENAGGHVAAGRVNGDLALSRAVGDWKFKMSDSLGPDQQQVIALPDITHKEAHKGDYLLIACDGIFEHMDWDEVTHVLYDALKKDRNPAAALEILLQRSLESGSKDNMTAILILFEDGTGYDNPSAQLVFGPIVPDDAGFMGAFREFAAGMNYANECEAYIEKWCRDRGLPPCPPSSNEAIPLDDNLVRQIIAHSNWRNVNLGQEPDDDPES